MPEYSSTTITPADAVKVPAMNGSTSGNFQLDALRNYILASKGQANGLASLDANGKLPAAQLPDLADDVIVVASPSNLPATGEDGKLYIVKSGSAGDNLMYRWDTTAEDYVQLSVDLTAYETKADASNLKSAIDSNTARIENLEQEHGGLVITQYRGSNLVPSGKAKNAKVVSIVGKTRAWNQMADVPSNISTTLSSSYSIASDGSYYTVTFYASGSNSVIRIYYSNPIKLKNGHTYMFGGGLSGNTIYGYDSNSQSLTIGDLPCVKTMTADFDLVRINMNYIATVTSGQTVNIPAIFIRDLTLIFPEGVPSTVAECVQKCPDILSYDSYGYSLVDTEVEGVISKDSNDVTLGSFSLPTSVILRSAGTVAEVLDVESGEVTHPIGVVDLGTLNWSIKSGASHTFKSWGIDTIVKAGGYAVVPNAVCSSLVVDTYNHAFDDATTVDKTISIGPYKDIGFTDSNISSSDIVSNKIAKLNGVMFYFELATPSAYTNIGATPNCMMATEGGGTISTQQTQTPVIDNCMDVAYLAL